MSKTAKDYAATYTKPELREKLKAKLTKGSKGGRAGQWSARKSQLLTHEYEAAGGGYKGERSESQKSLKTWTEEKWQTKDGSARARVGKETKRYLPKQAWGALSETEKNATDAKKRAGSRRGKQFVANTKAAKTARRHATAHGEGPTKTELYAKATKLGVKGRSTMTREQLRRAVAPSG